jgi:hypothetical protein
VEVRGIIFLQRWLGSGRGRWPLEVVQVLFHQSKVGTSVKTSSKSKDDSMVMIERDVLQMLKSQLLESTKLASSQELEILQAQNRYVLLQDTVAKMHGDTSDLNREYQRSFSALSHKSSVEIKALKAKIRGLELENYKVSLNHAQTEEALTTAKLQIKRMGIEVQYIEKSHLAREKEKERVITLYRVAR